MEQLPHFGQQHCRPNHMMTSRIAAFTLLAVTVSVASDAEPVVPSAKQVAEVLGVDAKRVTHMADPQRDERLKGKVIWLASYTIAGENECGLTITLFPAGKLKTDFIKRIGKDQNDFQQITMDDGDVVYHSLRDRGDQGTYYMTTLVNHERDWDMTLILSCKTGIGDRKLPLAIDTEGPKLISKLEALIRKSKEEASDGTTPETTKPATKPADTDRAEDHPPTQGSKPRPR